MTRILWLSRHTPLDSQRAALARHFGPDVAIDHDRRPFDRELGAACADILARAARYDEVVIVAPVSIVERLTAAGLRPLYAEMALCAPGEAETTAPGDPPRHYRFVKFTRLLRVEIVKEELR